MGVSAATIFAASPTVTALTFQRSESPQKSLADSWGDSHGPNHHTCDGLDHILR